MLGQECFYDSTWVRWLPGYCEEAGASRWSRLSVENLFPLYSAFSCSEK